MKTVRLKARYLKQFPEQLQEGILYISEEFSLTGHKCCCGCGEDVYLKLGPAKWELTKEPDGTVSLYPSVGNWKYACRSHYWISANKILEAGPMSTGMIKRIQERDRRDRQQAIEKLNASKKSAGRRLRAKAVLQDWYRRIEKMLRNL
jgi:Family of unknown function (DUF6527)